MRVLIDENNVVVELYFNRNVVDVPDEIPAEPEAKIGKTNVKYYNPEKKAIEWRQEDRPLTMEELLQQNSKSIQDLNIAMSDMIGG